MNKQCFRVIFSKTLQRLVVTSELAKSEGKSTENPPSLFRNFLPISDRLHLASSVPWAFVAFFRFSPC